ncbi:nSTAND1 domain-containing NTPase [Micromonospora chersina]
MVDRDVRPTDQVDVERIEGRMQFADSLTLVRERAGLTVRQVAAKAGVTSAHSTVGDWFAGRGLPSLASQDVFVKVLAACGVSEPPAVEAWLQAWRRVRRSPGPRAQALEPYRGLATFDVEDACWYFGREALTAQLLQRVMDLYAARGGLQLVVGPSGAGKSSLLRAGLLAHLEAPEFASKEEAWRVQLLTPGVDSRAQLAARLEAARMAAGPTLLVVDQAEQLFTGDMSVGEAAEFLDEVATLCQPPAGAVAVLALRADFYGHALRHPALLGAAQHEQLTVGPMSLAALRSAITEPARRAGVEIEDGLVELLLAELAVTESTDAADAGILPLLSHALYATWHHDQGKRLTCRGYRQVGGVQGAVRASATEVYDQLDAGQQRLARRMLLSLVHVGVDTADTRRRVAITDLLGEFGPDAGEVERILDMFIARRLITAETGGVQISHEALLTAWPALRQWLAADRASLVLRQQLHAATISWQTEQRDPAALYGGTRLAAAQGWAAEHPEDVSPAVAEFLAASTRHARRRARRLYQLVAALTALALLSGLLAGYAFQQRTAANTQRGVALAQRNEAISRMVAGRADWLRGRDVSLSRQLALTAYRVAPTVEARSSLLDAAAAPAVARLGRFTAAVQSVALSSDGRLLVAGGADGSVRIWSAASPVPRPVGPPLSSSAAAVFATALRPDGHLLAAGGADGVVHLWGLDADYHAVALRPLPTSGATLYAVAFSPDGRFLVAGSADHQVWRWDVSDPRSIRSMPTLEGPADAVQTVTFSPDGRLLAAGSADHTTRLWDLTRTPGPEHIATLRGHTGKVFAAAFSPDGRVLATASTDQTTRLWRVANPRYPVMARAPLTGPSSWVNAVAYSPDGQTLAVGSSDKKVTLYEVSTGRAIQTLPHPAPLTGLAFTEDGRSIATSSTDGYVRWWSLPGRTQLAGDGAIFSVTFDPASDIFAVAGRDETIQLWHLDVERGPTRQGPSLRRPSGHDGYVGTAAFAPTGHLLAAGSRSGDVELWDTARPDKAQRIGPPLAAGKSLVQTLGFSGDGTVLAAGGDDSNVYLWDITDRLHPSPRATIRGKGALVLSVAFSPDKRVLAVADTDATVRLFDVSDPSRPHPIGAPLTGFDGYAYSVMFSPDGGLLAVGSADKTVRLWRVDDPTRPVPLSSPLLGPSSYVYWVSFHPDGRTIAGASTDGTVWTWDIQNPSRPAVVASLAHADAAFYVASFSPDGQALVAGASDGTIRMWPTDTRRAVAETCATIGAPVTREEWSQYVPAQRYRPTC